MDWGDPGIDAAHTGVDRRAAPFGGDYILAILAVAVLDELQGNPPVVLRVVGEIDVGHTAPPELLQDLVMSDGLQVSLHSNPSEPVMVTRCSLAAVSQLKSRRTRRYTEK